MYSQNEIQIAIVTVLRSGMQSIITLYVNTYNHIIITFI